MKPGQLHYRVCGRPGTLASIAVQSFGDSPSGFMVPPTAVLEPQDETAPDRYLLNIDIASYDSIDPGPNLRDDIEAAAYARRESISGDKFDPLPLQIWLDEPDFDERP